MLTRDESLWVFDEPVAPPIPSRPVRPPEESLIAGRRRLADHVFSFHGPYDCADLHALGDITGVVNFVDKTRCQPDLVAVG